MNTLTHNRNHRENGREWIIGERRERDVDNAGLVDNCMNDFQVVFTPRFSLAVYGISRNLGIFKVMSRHDFRIMWIKVRNIVQWL